MTITSKLTTFTIALMAVALIATTAMADRWGARGEGPQGNGPFMEMDFAAMDSDKDGKVTPAEIEALRTARLMAADADKDGFLSPDELSAMAMGRMQARATDMATQMIERQDADGDGKLSLAEMQPRTPQERMFRRLDTDNDGALSEAEIAAAKDRMAERSGARKKGHQGNQGSMHGQGNN